MLFKIIYRTILFYFLVATSYKIMGKREVGELGIFDLVISLLISQLIAVGIENYKESIWYVIVPIIILVVLQVSLAYFALKNGKVRNLLDGNESIIIYDGKLNFKEMIKQRYNLEDLLVQLREHSIKSIEDVDYAILETNGKLSVFEKKDRNSTFPLPIILDGEIEKKNLKFIQKDLKWLNSMLDSKNIKLNEAFYAFYKNNDLYILKKNEAKENENVKFNMEKRC